MIFRRIIFKWPWVILVIAAHVGCNGPLEGTPEPTPEPTATATPQPIVTSQLILDNACNNLSSLRSASFTIEHVEGGIEVFPGVIITRTHGSVRMPDEYQLTIEAEASGTYLEIRVINVSGHTYMTNLFTGQWQEVSTEVVPVQLANLGAKLGDLTKVLQDHQWEDTEIVGSENFYVISGLIKSDDLAPVFSASQLGSTLDIKLWVSEKNYLLKQIEISGPVLNTDTDAAVHIISLSDINEPAEIPNPIP